MDTIPAQEAGVRTVGPVRMQHQVRVKATTVGINYPKSTPFTRLSWYF